MDAVQVSVVGLLLVMTFNPVTAKLLERLRCGTCPEGRFLVKNCSVTNRRWTSGIQCRKCTNCSDADQDTLVWCSSLSDSLCGNRSSPGVTAAARPVSAPEAWIIVTVTGLSLVLVLLLSLFLSLVSCRNRKGLDPL